MPLHLKTLATSTRNGILAGVVDPSVTKYMQKNVEAGIAKIAPARAHLERIASAGHIGRISSCKALYRRVAKSDELSLKDVDRAKALAGFYADSIAKTKEAHKANHSTKR